MTFIQSIILGIIQGITEFLPISSSGHLVIIPYLLGWSIPEDQIFPFDVLVQLGTLIAVVIYFWRDLRKIIDSVVRGLKEKNFKNEIPAKTGLWALIATIPAGLVGFLLKDQIEEAFSKPILAGALLLITAVLLFVSEKIGKNKKTIKEINWFDAVWIGVFQSMAVFPGISRSGSTIAGGLTRNLKRETAGRFAFLMAVPIMAAAGLLSIIDLFGIPNFQEFIPVMMVGFFVSGIVGYLSIRWLIQYINEHSLLPFAIYCAVLGIGTILFSWGFSPADPQKSAPIPEEAVRIAYDSNLTYMSPIINDCTNSTQGINYILFPIGLNHNQTFPADIVVTLGVYENIPGNVFQIGEEVFQITAHQTSHLSNLTAAQIVQIFSGDTLNWTDFYQQCQNCFSLPPDEEYKNQAIQILVYPAETPHGNISAEIFGTSDKFSQAVILTTIGEARQILQNDPLSIGVLPERMIVDPLRIVQTEGKQSRLALPILAYITKELEGANESFLLCIQKKM